VRYFFIILFIAVFLFSGVGEGRAAFELRESGAEAQWIHPGKLGVLDHRELSSFHSQIFSSKDLAVSGFSAASFTRLGGIAFRITQFGPSVYREQEFVFSHGFKVFSGLNAGYSLKGLVLKIDGYGSAAKFSLDLGTHLEVTRRLGISLSGMNLNRPAFGVTREFISPLWTLGGVFKVMPSLKASLDLEGFGASSTRFKTGLDLELSPSFSLRGGLENNPSRFSGGFSARWNGMALNYVYRHHPFLSGSHHMGLTFSWAGPPTVKIDPEEPVHNPNSKIDFSSASEEDISSIKGIGKFTAQKIVAYRDQNGIKSMEDMLNVPGITRRTFFLLKDRCVLGAPRP
jgi:hypothetical protein